ncbi:amino acid ABC transporter substrate-binding protein [Desulfoluna limicola]|uniref:Amino acid ABC transporter substrate-binding protein n=1 Tax=Desulfoluna limicola TaxID=2810562 RepID=A0ABN6F471_9BACT|nr:transporter substrate-binding domain-containing protein [Desulfoluna limicola]BCS97234.1 amino acid ABC transporter substrate-binding protein [Desulfoluna limicola]
MKRWLAGLMMVLMLACSGQLWAEESVIESIQKKGVIRVGMSTFVPWAMRDKTGELIGFEIDVARELAKDMGVKVEFVPTNWSGIIPALLTGKFDVIIGGMGITPKRNLKVNFSDPYDFTGMSLVAHKKKAAGFSSLADFDKKNVTIAVRIGTTAEMAAKKFIPNATFKLFENESQALQELYLGRVHAVVASAPLPTFQALKFPEKLFVPMTEPFTKEPIGFAVKKGDFDALNYFNNWIRVKQADGFLASTKHHWFETRDWADQVK